MNKSNFANLALMLAAFIWGTAFVAQSVGMDYVGPLTFLCTRSFIGAAALLPVSLLIDHGKKKNGTFVENTPTDRKNLLVGGILCGLALCVASGLQQIGIQYTSVGNAGFITSMYMLIVPVLSIFLGKKVPKKIWFCIAVAAVGLYFLSISGGLSVSKGDVLIAVCALFFAIQIMIVDYYAPLVDGVKLSCMQFTVAGVISLVPALIFETPEPYNIVRAIVPILYAGLFSSGIAFTLQIVAQKYAQPTVATLLMSMESVFSMLGGIVLLSQIPSARQVFGCVLVFCAVIASQVSKEAIKGIFKAKHRNA
ncbi:MAG: DMT family transporter [Lachnospiraceae bacterium]|nr:DMT family transporter [Lachnospiraceae bacterium]